MGVPNGYRTIPKPAEQVKMVPYDRLRTGREVVFIRTRRIKSRGEEYVTHEFTDVQTGANFGLWGAALFDLQLAGVPERSKMFLQYEGKEARQGGRTAHVFTVAVAGDVRVTAEPSASAEADDDDLPF